MIGTRAIASNKLDAPVAALAGLSVAFLAFAVPGDILAELVDLTGIAALLPESEPVFGLRARIGLGAAGAILVFTLAFLALRGLGRIGSRRNARRPEPRLESEPPRLRRRDHHPDAPARAPICAARDFGEPAPPILRSKAPKPERPSWLPEVTGDEPAPELDDFGFEPLDPTAFADKPVSQVDDLGFEPLDPPAFASAPSTPAEEEPEPLDLAAFEPEPAPAPQPVVRNAPSSRPSLDELMARLENGLTGRGGPAPARAVPNFVPQAGSFPEPSAAAADDRLQSAIDSLHRLTSRQS